MEINLFLNCPANSRLMKDNLSVGKDTIMCSSMVEYAFLFAQFLLRYSFPRNVISFVKYSKVCADKNNIDLMAGRFQMGLLADVTSSCI